MIELTLQMFNDYGHRIHRSMRHGEVSEGGRLEEVLQFAKTDETESNQRNKW